MDFHDFTRKQLDFHLEIGRLWRIPPKNCILWRILCRANALHIELCLKHLNGWHEMRRKSAWIWKSLLRHFFVGMCVCVCVRCAKQLCGSCYENTLLAVIFKQPQHTDQRTYVPFGGLIVLLCVYSVRPSLSFLFDIQINSILCVFCFISSFILSREKKIFGYLCSFLSLALK